MERLDGRLPTVKWDFEGIHYFDNGPLTAQYLLVLDTLNFCFWPGLYSLSLVPSLCFVNGKKASSLLEQHLVVVFFFWVVLVLQHSEH